MKNIFSVHHSAGRVDLALLIARVGIAALMLTHGIPKFSLFGQSPVQFMDFGLGAEVSLVLAICAEVGCSLLVLLGLGTRLAVLPLIITMLTAIFHVHSADPFAIKEKAVLYLMVYVVLLILGSGRYSVDKLISDKK